MARKRLTVYLAGSWTQREKLRVIRAQLDTLGLHVRSQWLDFNCGYYDQDFRVEAERDYNDIRRSDFLILDTDDIDTKGGRDWEAGYATGIGKRVLRVGPVITPFHAVIPLGFASWETCLAYLATAIEHADAKNN